MFRKITIISIFCEQKLYSNFENDLPHRKNNTKQKSWCCFHTELDVHFGMSIQLIIVLDLSLVSGQLQKSSNRHIQMKLLLAGDMFFVLSILKSEIVAKC